MVRNLCAHDAFLVRFLYSCCVFGVVSSRISKCQGAARRCSVSTGNSWELLSHPTGRPTCVFLQPAAGLCEINDGWVAGRELMPQSALDGGASSGSMRAWKNEAARHRPEFRLRQATLLARRRPSTIDEPADRTPCRAAFLSSSRPGGLADGQPHGQVSARCPGPRIDVTFRFSSFRASGSLAPYRRHPDRRKLAAQFCAFHAEHSRGAYKQNSGATGYSDGLQRLAC